MSVHDDLAEIEAEWRRFEAEADCTVFQTFAWQSGWQRHIGGPAGSRPAIVVVRAATGEIVMLAPFAIAGGGAIRRLAWGASDLSDYNAPLLAPDFSRRLPRDGFPALWREIVRHLRRDPRFRFDALVLEKMPETVGAQPNPFLALPVSLNPSGAYLTNLGDDWDAFYVGKRSSATRRRDRTKRKRLGDIGPVAFATPSEAQRHRCRCSRRCSRRRRDPLRAWASPTFSPCPAARRSSATSRPIRRPALSPMSAGSTSARRLPPPITA